MDLSTTTHTILEPQITTVLRTGIEVTIPPNHVEILKTRSSLAKSEIFIKRGVIDSDYTGEILLLTRNHNSSILFKVRKKNQLAQMLILSVLNPRIKEVTNIRQTE